jgi:hypothetical protein
VPERSGPGQGGGPPAAFPRAFRPFRWSSDGRHSCWLSESLASAGIGRDLRDEIPLVSKAKALLAADGLESARPLHQVSLAGTGWRLLSPSTGAVLQESVTAIHPPGVGRLWALAVRWGVCRQARGECYLLATSPGSAQLHHVRSAAVSGMPLPSSNKQRGRAGQAQLTANQVGQRRRMRALWRASM